MWFCIRCHLNCFMFWINVWTKLKHIKGSPLEIKTWNCQKSGNTPFKKRRIVVGSCMFFLRSQLPCSSLVVCGHQCGCVCVWGDGCSQHRWGPCVGCCHPPSISPPPLLLLLPPLNLTTVSCHSLMDAPGPTIAHSGLLLLSLRSQSHQGQIYFTVVHLSRSACWHLCYWEQEGMCVSLQKRKKSSERDEMTVRRREENNKMSGELPCEQMYSVHCPWLTVMSVALMGIQSVRKNIRAICFLGSILITASGFL